ncbi:hypothetical protein P4O66_018931, partial [Electrophorus voltai]
WEFRRKKKKTSTYVLNDLDIPMSTYVFRESTRTEAGEQRLATSEMPVNTKHECGEPTTVTTTTPSPGPNVVAIVVPIVVVVVLLLVGLLIFLFCVVKKKRQTEGTYQPSAEEQSGARSVEVPNTLKLPKEERLI